MGHGNLPCTHQPTNSAYAGKSCVEYMYQTRIMKFHFAIGVVCLEPIIPGFLQFVLKRLHVHIHIFSRIVGPLNYQRQENVLPLQSLFGGSLSGKTNSGPQLYWSAVIPNTLNPSVLMPTRGCLGSAALSPCNSSNFFDATHPMCVQSSNSHLHLVRFFCPFCAMSSVWPSLRP